MNEKTDNEGWESYHRQLRIIAATKGRCEDGCVYLPDPDEVQQRASDLDWLQELGFDNCVIESVMRYDHPTIDWIDRQINIRGRRAAEVSEVIRPLLICP